MCHSTISIINALGSTRSPLLKCYCRRFYRHFITAIFVYSAVSVFYVLSVAVITAVIEASHDVVSVRNAGEAHAQSEWQKYGSTRLNRVRFYSYRCKNCNAQMCSTRDESKGMALKLSVSIEWQMCGTFVHGGDNWGPPVPLFCQARALWLQ